MALVSRILSRRMGLPPSETRRIDVEHGLPVPMRDGIELIADRYSPSMGEYAPVILIRSPYGRKGGWDAIARAFAERSFQVVLQSTRGTHDAGGDFEPGVFEAKDGLDTVAWLRDQPWFPGILLTWGQSYMGYTQWALASSGHIPEWKAAAIGVAPSDWCSGYTHPGGVFSLGNALYWIDGPARLTSGKVGAIRSFAAGLTRPRRLRAVERHLPMRDADKLAFGDTVDYYQRWVSSDAHDAYAASVDFRDGARHLPPVHLAAGWYDFFLTGMLRDYERLRRAGQDVRLLIGPGKHESGTTKEAGREQADWLAHPAQSASFRGLERPVRVYVLGADRWAELSDWPPPDSQARRWFLHPNRTLARDNPSHTPSVSIYRYDPADPTPNIGGAMPDLPSRYGPTDNQDLESRRDVLTFTSEPVPKPLEIIGSVHATIYVRSSAKSSDIYARLCDVLDDGRSINICEGIVRIDHGEAGDARGQGLVREAKISMAGTAFRFEAHHRIRLQVSSGAHPRFTRNLGTNEPVATATTLEQSVQEIFHHEAFPSHVVLPHRVES